MHERKTDTQMQCSWKPNWPEAKQHFIDWWSHDGLVLGASTGAPNETPHEHAEDPGPAASIEKHYSEPAWRARHNHYVLSHHTFHADTLPIADTMIGPGSLALLIGSEPRFLPETVWFEPSMKDVGEPESLPPLQFDPASRWWKITQATVKECVELGRGKYLVGCPDLVENIDILAALRDPQRLLMDMVERPEWVSRKVDEINQVFFDAYSRIYEIIKLDDESSAFACFGIWGPGKVAKVQCDASAMFSPAMFERFVVPALTQQCDWLDCSLFHLDGHHCMCHLDLLLAIESLDAIEWTPDPQVPPGGAPEWYDLYRKILNAGKSVQAIGVAPNEVIPLLDAVGGKGMYIAVGCETEAEAEELTKKVDPYR
jgi:hypothetical protein